jgi:hypothetical protein
MEIENIPEDVKALHAAGYEWLLIDGPPLAEGVSKDPLLIDEPEGCPISLLALLLVKPPPE